MAVIVMNNYLQLKKSNCKNCYKCIRNCPVKSIKFSDGQANIVKDECILCGMCFIVCPQNAKQIRNDVDQVKDAIKSGRKVYASVAPSFVANYDGVNIKSMENLLKKLGFEAAEETAIGATIVKREYENMVKENKQDVIISSCCHSVNTLIQKYHPEVLPYLADVLSPMQAHCSKIKAEHPDAYTVFIGPCISKKEEADQYPGIVDCALTFEELSNWIENENLSFETTQEDIIKGRARLFPTTGGIIRSMFCDDSDYDYVAIDGVENCIRAIEDIAQGKMNHCFVEMSSCVGSCVGGPAMDRDHRTPVKDFISVNRYSGNKDFDIPKYSHNDLQKDISFTGIHRQMPGSNAIKEILLKMGKSSPEQELNCGSCGYNTCREKAIAVYQGKADLTMCLPFLKEKAESFSDTILNNTPNGIIVLNEELEVQQVNDAACKIMNIKNSRDILGCPVVRVLNPTDYITALTTKSDIHDKQTYLPEYKKYVEETIIYDENYHIIMGIMRDITKEETVREKKEALSRQTIEITDKVIDKQMRVVQEIASLLGETTAETKIALTKLKETLNNE